METKPGVKTTEFWFALFTNIAGFADLFGIVDAGINNKFGVIAIAAVNGLYAVGRGRAKQGVAYTP